jgi:hypothetical protein
MSFWNDSAAENERAESDTIPVFSSDRFRQLENARVTGFKIFVTIIILMGMTWLGSLLYSIWRMF